MIRAAFTSRRIAAAPAVLLVDDNADDRLFFELAWEKSEPAQPLRMVGSWREAVEYLNGTGGFADRKRFPFPSVILLDMRLPDGNGAELVRWIRAHPRFHRLTIVMLSGSAHERDVNLAYASGANSFLVKSGNLDQLQQIVSLIQSHWLGQDLSVPASRVQG